MTNPSQSPLVLSYLRWSARFWSIMVLLAMLTVTFTKDTGSNQLDPVSDKILLAMSWLVVLGLAIAWRLEGPGGALAVSAVIGYNLAYFIFRDRWLFAQPAGLVLILFMLVPGLIFTLCWALCGRETAEVAEISATT